jgi:pimeloyl-ACP methyl ester carboxylesterase
MTDAPETHDTPSADGSHLAYQVGGQGPVQLVFLHRPHPIDLLSEDPGFVRVRKRPGSFSHTVWLDTRGGGASEGTPADSLAGEIFDADVTAVLDAAGFEQPALVAEDASGGRAIHFSVTHPDRVSAIVLVNSFAHYVREKDYPWGVPREPRSVRGRRQRCVGHGCRAGGRRPQPGRRPALPSLGPHTGILDRVGASSCTCERVALVAVIAAPLGRLSTPESKPSQQGAGTRSTTRSFVNDPIEMAVAAPLALVGPTI